MVHHILSVRKGIRMTRQSLGRGETLGQRKDSERWRRPSVEIEAKEASRKKAGSYDFLSWMQQLRVQRCSVLPETKPPDLSMEVQNLLPGSCFSMQVLV